MSKSIDEKVVSMKFDNSNFEKNVSTSMGTLNKLKRSLDLSGASKGLDSISSAAKNVDMSSLGKGVEAVQAKFSALQVIAVTALANITNSAIETGKRLVSSLTIDQITAGFNKYEQKTASVQTIMNATGKSIAEVNGYLEKLMWFSDETSYGFTDMTAALATMTASGGDIDKLIPMIEGVANATAFAGKGASEFSRVMQFAINQAYSLGYMQVQDWKSIEGATVNSKQLQEALIAAGEALGKFEKGTVTLENFRSTLSDKWLDKDVMEMGFGAFSKVTEAAYELINDETNAVNNATTAYKVLNGELGETSEEYLSLSDSHKELIGSFTDVEIAAAKSAQEAKTFTEAIEATKDAVSSGWMSTFELIFGNKDQATARWSDFCDNLWEIFASGGETRNSILEKALGSNWSRLEEQINDAGVSTDRFREKLTEVANGKGVSLDGLIKEYGSLEGALTSGKLSTDLVIETLKELSKTQEEVSGTTESTTDKLNDYTVQTGDCLSKIAKEYGTTWEELYRLNKDIIEDPDLIFTGQILKLSDAEGDCIELTNDQAEAFKKLASEADKAGTPINDLVNMLSQPSGGDLIAGSIDNIMKSIIAIKNVISEAWSEIFNPAGIDGAASALYKILETVNNITSKILAFIEKNSDKLKSTFKGLFAIISIITDIIGGAFKAGLQILGAILGATGFNVLNLTASVGDAIVEFKDWIDQNGIISKSFGVIVNAVKKVIAFIKKLIGHFEEMPFVQEIISKLRDTFADCGSAIDVVNVIIEKLVSIFMKCKEVVSGWIDKLLEIPLVKKVVEELRGAFGSLDEYFGEGIQRITDFIDRVKELDGTGIENIKAAFQDFYENVFSYFINFDTIKANISGLAQSFVDGFFDIGDGVDTAKQKILNFKKSLTTGLFESGGKLEWFKDKLLGFYELAESKLPSVFALGSAAVLIKSLDKIGKAFDTLATPMNVVKNLTTGLTNAFKTVSKGLAFKARAAGIKDLAIAIGILAASLLMISLIPTDKLWGAVGALAVLVVLMGVLTLAVGKVGNLKDVGNLAKASLAFLAMAGALIILAGALKIMEGLDWNKAWKNALLLGGLAVALGVAVGILGKLAPEMSISAFGLVAFALALRVMVGVLKDLDKTNFENIKQSLLVLGAIMLSLGALALMASKIQIGTGLGMLGLIIALKLFIGILDDICDIDLDKIQDNIKSFILVFGSLALLMAAMSLAGKNAGQAGLGILAMSAGILIMIKAIKELSGMKTSDIERGTKAISSLLFMFGIIVALSKFAGEHAAKAGRALVTASVGILILVGAIYLLSRIDPADITRGVTAISVLLGMFSLLIASTKNIPKNCTGVIITLTIAIVALVACVAILAGLDEGGLKRAVVSVSVLIALFAGLIFATKFINTSGKDFLKTIAVLATITLVVAALSLILKNMADLPVESTLANAISLSVLILALSAACLLLSYVPATGATAGIIALLEVFGAAGLIVLVAALLNLIPGIREFMDGGFELLKQFASGIGEIIGSFIGGFGSGLSSGLPDIATNLSTFMTNLQPFIDGAKQINEDTMTGVKMLAETILILTGASLLESIGSFLGFGQGLDDFGTKLASLGDGLSTYGESVKGLNTEDISNSAVAAQALSDVVNSFPRLGGKFQELFGEKSPEEFGTQIAALGTGMKAYGESVKGLNNEDITNSAAAAQALSDVASTLPKSGKWQEIFGEKDAGEFGTQIAALGTGMKAYGESVVGLPTDAILASAPCGQALSDLADTLPKSGIWQKIFGKKDAGDFGEQLTKLGDGLQSYGASVKELPIESINTSVSAGTSLSNLVKSLDGSDKVDLKNFGKNIEKLGDKLKGYYASISGIDTESLTVSTQNLRSLFGLINQMAGLDTSGVSTFSQALEDLGNTSIDGFVTAFSNAGPRIAQAVGMLITSLNTAIASTRGSMDAAFSQVISSAVLVLASKQPLFYNAGTAMMLQFNNGLRSGSMNSGVAFDTIVNTMINSISSKQSAFMIAGVQLITSFNNGIKSASTSIISVLNSTITSQSIMIIGAINSMLSLSVEAIMSKQSQFTDSGKTLMRGLVNGIKMKIGEVRTSIYQALSDASNTIRSFYTSFYMAGQYLGNGLVIGIQNQKQSVYNAAYALGKEAVRGEADGQKSESPSKATIQAGEWLGEGLIIGIDRIGASVFNSAKALGMDATLAISDAMSSIPYSAFDEINARPSIRPVLDMDRIELANIQLGTGITLELNKPVDSMAKIMYDAQSEINASNYRVVSAVNDLREDINYFMNNLPEVALYANTTKMASSLARPMNRELNILSKRGPL